MDEDHIYAREQAFKLTQQIYLYDNPAEGLEEIIVQSRPCNWHHEHWRDRVWDVFLLSYSDYRDVEGCGTEAAEALSYLDTITYCILAPDRDLYSAHRWSRGLRYQLGGYCFDIAK